MSRLNKEFDPLAYIERAFLDTPRPDDDEETSGRGSSNGTKERTSPEPAVRFRKTGLRAPRPRRARDADASSVDAELRSLLDALPQNLEFLIRFFDDSVTSNYYRGEFRESRDELIRRLVDPELSLEEVSRLLGVCPATVRRYTNRDWLAHHRTQGGQRRFRLSNVVRFVQEHGRLPQT